MEHQDLPVTLHNEKRGLLTIEDDRLDVLQLSRDGRRGCPVFSSVRTQLTSVVSAKAIAYL